MTTTVTLNIGDLDRLKALVQSGSKSADAIRDELKNLSFRLGHNGSNVVTRLLPLDQSLSDWQRRLLEQFLELLKVQRCWSTAETWLEIALSNVESRERIEADISL